MKATIVIFCIATFTSICEAQSLDASLDSLLKDNFSHQDTPHDQHGGISFYSGSINIYKKLISPLYSSRCAFHPSCSQYSKLAFEKYNPVRALLLSLDRLMRCHPMAIFYSNDYDHFNHLSKDNP